MVMNISAILVFQNWIDPNLQWDPALYNDVDSIVMQRSKIWLPDIVIYGQ
jgi:hypothetical protein